MWVNQDLDVNQKIPCLFIAPDMFKLQLKVSRNIDNISTNKTKLAHSTFTSHSKQSASYYGNGTVRDTVKNMQHKQILRSLRVLHPERYNLKVTGQHKSIIKGRHKLI